MDLYRPMKSISSTALIAPIAIGASAAVVAGLLLLVVDPEPFGATFAMCGVVSAAGWAWYAPTGRWLLFVVVLIAVAVPVGWAIHEMAAGCAACT